MKKVIIVADSTFMPRPGQPYEATWIYKLKKKYPHIDFIDKSSRGSTTSRLVTEGGGGLDLLETYNPDAAVISLGMVDCAPRLFDKNSFEYRLARIYLPSSLGSRYADYKKRKRGRRPEFTEVSPGQFKLNLINYSTRAEKTGCSVIFIKIMPANSFMMTRSPHAFKNIILYNSIIDSVCEQFKNVRSIDPFMSETDPDMLVIDETHSNAAGQDITFKMMKKALVELKIC